MLIVLPYAYSAIFLYIVYEDLYIRKPSPAPAEGVARVRPR